MDRRQAVTAAAAASLTFLLGAAGLTANATILGSSPSNGVGDITPIAAVAPASAERPAAGVAASTIAPAAAVAADPADPATTVPAEQVTAVDGSSSGNESSSAEPAPEPSDHPVDTVSPTVAPPTTVRPEDPPAKDDDSKPEPPDHVGATDDD